MERLNVYLCGKLAGAFARTGLGEKLVCDSIARQIDATRRNLPDLLDQANAEHPSPVYSEIAEGIRLRIRQLDR